MDKTAPTAAPAAPPPRPAVAKTRRVLAALDQQEADRVPVGEFFWTNFVRRGQRQNGPTFGPYRHWDLDLMVVNPNMDPHLTGVQVVEQTGDRTVVRTGFGATIEVHERLPHALVRQLRHQTCEQIEGLVFDDPRDQRRYHAASTTRSTASATRST